MKGLYTIANGKDESVNGQYTFSFVAFFLNYMYLGAYLEGYAGKGPALSKKTGSNRCLFALDVPNGRTSLGRPCWPVLQEHRQWRLHPPTLQRQERHSEGQIRQEW